MECYKEFPRGIGMLTCLSGVVHLMAGLVLLMGINAWFAGGYALLYLVIHFYYFPRQVCANCYYFKRDCISLKGKLAGYLHRRGRETLFYGGMKRANRSIYLLWVFPFLVLIGAHLRGRPILLGDILLACTLIILMVMRQLMRQSLGCRVCMMREQCPNAKPDTRRGVKIIADLPAEPSN
ncbi:MAG: hypothetical protein GY835_13235 [bacterium]|nr:hypothetical protein [bacterium]